MKYVHEYTDRHGTVRRYFRRTGQPKIPLLGKPGTPKFLRSYEAALNGSPLPPETKERVKKAVEISINGHEPMVGVYILMLCEEVVYIGSSLNMLIRVADHRKNGRAFDKAFYIGTRLTERYALERSLIRALDPRQNRTHRQPRKAHPGNIVATLGITN